MPGQMTHQCTHPRLVQFLSNRISISIIIIIIIIIINNIISIIKLLAPIDRIQTQFVRHQPVQRSHQILLRKVCFRKNNIELVRVVVMQIIIKAQEIDTLFQLHLTLRYHLSVNSIYK